MTKRSKTSTVSTEVVKLGMDYFTTDEHHTTESVDVPCFSEESQEPKETKKSKREKKNGRFYRFVKRHFLSRKQNSNSVQEIHIVPEGDELKWARRAAGSAASRSSDETGSSGEYRLEVVHDMAEEYTLDS